MLIVCTKDQSIVQWAQNQNSGSNKWNVVAVIPPGSTQPEASEFLANTLATLNLNTTEPLCLFAHGNDSEIGDPGSGPNDWLWTAEDITNIFKERALKFRGSILIQACAQNVANFSAALTINLENKKILTGVWVYGYNLPVDVEKRFPNPTLLSQQVDLQGTQVNL